MSYCGMLWYGYIYIYTYIYIYREREREIGMAWHGMARHGVRHLRRRAGLPRPCRRIPPPDPGTTSFYLFFKLVYFISMSSLCIACVYINMHIYICIYAYIQVCTSISLSLYIYIYIHILLFILDPLLASKGPCSEEHSGGGYAQSPY